MRPAESWRGGTGTGSGGAAHRGHLGRVHVLRHFLHLLPAPRVPHPASVAPLTAPHTAHTRANEASRTSAPDSYAAASPSPSSSSATQQSEHSEFSALASSLCPGLSAARTGVDGWGEGRASGFIMTVSPQRRSRRAACSPPAGFQSDSLRLRSSRTASTCAPGSYKLASFTKLHRTTAFRRGKARINDPGKGQHSVCQALAGHGSRAAGTGSRYTLEGWTR